MRAIDTVNLWIGRVVALLILVLTILITYEVTLRYGFSAPTVWGTELSTYLFATFILLGGGFALLHGDHVRMDVVYSRFSPRGRAILDILTAPFALLYCAVLVIEGSAMVAEAMASGRRTSTDWAALLWPWLLALPVGAGLLTLQVLANLVRDAVRATLGRELS
ncbi:TRAP transporter small permease subunit [Siccirubricoccus phaeus]|uniref:TRAP transporter small permease subunit n=1 Tax=Siccirubricoccus phaeus TaxID=2595053 RepID=UPI00165C1C02|nr:TRAP transporter small permease subunit [Siccirubricoccus phaeus]